MSAIGSIASRPGSRGGGRALAAVVAVTTGTALPVFLVGALAVQIHRSLGFSAARLGIVVAAFYLAASLGSLPAGAAAERFDAALMLRASAALSGAILLATALAVRSWAVLEVLLAAAGVASSMVQPAANAFLSRKVTSTRQGTAFGIKQSAIPLATLLGGLAVPGIGLTVGWRWAFGLAGILCVLSVLLPPRPRPAQAQPSARGAHPRVPALALAVLTAGFSRGIAAASSLAAFLVLSGVAAGLSKGEAGLVAALAGATAIAGRLAAGFRADRRGRRHLRAVTLMLATGTAGYLLLAISAAGHLTALFIPGAALAAGAGWGWNGLFNFALVRSYPQAPAWATGVSQTGGRLGAVAGPLIFGLVATGASYATAWLLCATLAGCSAVAITAGRRLLMAARPAAG